MQFPLVRGFGGVVSVPTAAVNPHPGAKVVFDTTADSRPDDVNEGLEHAARLLNLFGVSGLKAADVQIAVVLHGEATKSALNDTFYAARFDMGGNPNLRLVHELQLAGVEVYVCSQALNYKGFSESAVAKGISVADAALTVVMNKQAEGYAYVLIP